VASQEGSVAVGATRLCLSLAGSLASAQSAPWGAQWRRRKGIRWAEPSARVGRYLYPLAVSVAKEQRVFFLGGVRKEGKRKHSQENTKRYRRLRGDSFRLAPSPRKKR